MALGERKYSLTKGYGFLQRDGREIIVVASIVVELVFKVAGYWMNRSVSDIIYIVFPDYHIEFSDGPWMEK